MTHSSNNNCQHEHSEQAFQASVQNKSLSLTKSKFTYIHYNSYQILKNSATRTFIVDWKWKDIDY